LAYAFSFFFLGYLKQDDIRHLLCRTEKFTKKHNDTHSEVLTLTFTQQPSLESISKWKEKMLST